MVSGCWCFWWRGWGLRPLLCRRWRWRSWPPCRWRSLLPQRKPPRLLRSPLWLLALRRRWWSSALLLRPRRLLAFGRRLPDQGAVATLEPPGFRPLRMVLVPGLWHRHLLLPFPAGGRTSGSRQPGTFAGTLLAVRCGARDLEPAVGVASQLPDRQAALVQGRHRRQD
jgi:hypothetical protein